MVGRIQGRDFVEAAFNEGAQILSEFWRQLLVEATRTECIVVGRIVAALEIG